MKKIIALCKRNFIETLRDPLSLIFCLIFPIVMLVVMSVIIKNTADIPNNFIIQNYSVGICVFGFTFTSMMIAMSIASDKNTSFIKRLIISPTTNFQYYFSYVLTGMITAFIQSLLFFAVSLIFGMNISGKLLIAIGYLFFSALFYITLGILIGIICKNEKQTGPVSSIIVSLVGIIGGIFMPVSIFTGVLKSIVNILPFTHTVLISSDVFILGAKSIYPHVVYIISYTFFLWIIIFITLKIKKR